VPRQARSRRSCLLVSAADGDGVRHARAVAADEVVLDLLSAPEGACDTVVERCSPGTGRTKSAVCGSTR